MQPASSGGRRLRHAALAARKFALESGRTVTRKELSASARDAERALRLSAPQRLVLSQLVVCWGEHHMDRLLVWPSNQRLTAATGLSERSIRNAIRALIELQVLIPKDSPNGKRYAVRDEKGNVVDAFGFDLTPLYARRGEWAAATAEQQQRKELLKRSFDEITVCRRATEAALSALAQYYPAVDRTALESRLSTLKARTPKRSGATLPAGLVEVWNEIRQLAEEAFYQASCDGMTCRHIEAENESLSKTCHNGRQDDMEPAAQTALPTELSLPTLIVEACPVISDCAHPIRNAADLVSAGRFLRASLGAHPSAWTEAVEAIGAIHAATAVIYVLQLYDDDVSSGKHSIRSPGGYFRSIIRLVKRGEIDLQTELLALRRHKLAQGNKIGRPGSEISCGPRRKTWVHEVPSQGSGQQSAVTRVWRTGHRQDTSGVAI
ncbi:plasmid replication protein RepC [Microvirga splendida]|uniref:Replication protein C n=1 Tax=Microvirga splendida TaxID=2795727 RepID=A0ABS0Y4H5_9HYPH|nr:plasmid replication protein RepC [Microvirga splendida]MBJ6127209.1 replication protein C [Microvirga splendida]